MLKITWIEFFFRIIPETFILILGIHVISKKSINILKYILSSVLLSLMIFFVRWLPIYFGVHMIINIILIISIMVVIRIPIIKSIYSTFLVYFLLTLGEFLNMIMLNLLNIDTSIEFSNPLIKCLVGTPSLIILLISIIIFNYLLKMREGTKNISN
ncbi:MAG: hypothetical protein A370_02397 [Clostridium sp. Maddingley MBC34-26]|nr:MAG: hypothetical protein A370_02397 [Clostridium sp. Maddingley MBC34-26]